jgi:hypothetical protein
VKPVHLLSGARQELQGAVRRYEEHRPGLGEEFLVAVGDLLQRIATEAHTFPGWREDRPYRKAVMVHRFPFVIFFLPTLVQVCIKQKSEAGVDVRRTDRVAQNAR